MAPEHMGQGKEWYTGAMPVNGGRLPAGISGLHLLHVDGAALLYLWLWPPDLDDFILVNQNSDPYRYTAAGPCRIGLLRMARLHKMIPLGYNLLIIRVTY